MQQFKQLSPGSGPEACRREGGGMGCARLTIWAKGLCVCVCVKEEDPGEKRVEMRALLRECRLALHVKQVWSCLEQRQNSPTFCVAYLFIIWILFGVPSMEFSMKKPNVGPHHLHWILEVLEAWEEGGRRTTLTTGIASVHFLDHSGKFLCESDTFQRGGGMWKNTSQKSGNN